MFFTLCLLEHVSLNNLFADESLDLDPNYDPSDFLMGRNQNHMQDEGLHMHIRNTAVSNEEIPAEIHDDLAVSESDEENREESHYHVNVPKEVDEAEEGDLWF